jgi:acetoin utilization deacetylase AcuC-like enzyme
MSGMPIGTFYHPGFAAPIGDAHVMPMRKFQRVADEVAKMPFVKMQIPQAITQADVLAVHDTKYVDAVRTGVPLELAESQKFPWSDALYPSVLLTSGGIFAAANHALDEHISAALVSGFHHAHYAHGEGFCTFNGLIIAIEKLRAMKRIQSAAVLDMDLHYGNGTAQLCTSRPYIFHLSIYGNDYWNNAPFRDVTTRHHTDGPNHVSAALPDACNRATMLDIMHAHLPMLISNGKPDLLLYQAGADPYFEDPYSPLKLDHDDLLERDRTVFSFARQHNIPIAWVLAGGYTKDINKVVRVHTNTFIAAQQVYELM